jgi:hypothetical protein
MYCTPPNYVMMMMNTSEGKGGQGYRWGLEDGRVNLGCGLKSKEGDGGDAV